MLRALIAHEIRTVLGRRATLALLVGFAAILFIAARGGHLHHAEQVEASAQHAEKAAETQAKLRAALADDTSDVMSRLPTNVRPAADISPGALMDLATGASDLFPHTATVSMFSNSATIFGRYAMDEPETLASGPFDLAFVVLVFAPILLIALCFDILSRERDSGRLSLLLAAPVRLDTLVWSRLLARAAPVALLIALSVLLALLMSPAGVDASARWARGLVFLATAWVYLGLWVAVIALVASLRRGSATTIVLLITIWALVAQLVPAGIAAVAEVAAPPPSRLEYLTTLRQAKSAARQLDKEQYRGYLVDHPELSVEGDSKVPDYVRTAFISNQQAEAALAPIQREFESSLDSRMQTIDTLQYLSPVLVVSQMWNDLAGTSTERYQRYMRAVYEHREALAKPMGALIVAEKPLPPDVYDRLPTFDFPAEDLSAIIGGNAPALGYLALLILALGMTAQRRLSRSVL